jgi:plastocyanin
MSVTDRLQTPVRRLLPILFAGLVAAVPATAAPTVHTVTMRDMAFGPLPKAARVGDTIEWVNADMFRHTATAKDGSFEVDLVPKARARTVLRKAGAVAFYCRYHPGMTGTLVVAK